MLIQGSAVSDRTKQVIQYYTDIIDSGVDASKVLVLTLNSYKKKQFVETFKQNTKTIHYENPKIYTFYGLVYNVILENWPIIENSINIGNSSVLPNLTGLEISQLFFKKAIKEVGFADYNSKINLIHQLFRRYSIISNNNLSESEVAVRSNILKESFAQDAAAAIENFKKYTLEYRAFDYIRQLGLFNFVLTQTDHFKDIEYLVVDDADEITPLVFDFIKILKPQLKGVCVGYDRLGSTRLGFLNTDVYTVKQLENLFESEEVITCDNIGYKPIKAELKSYTRRLEMIDSSLTKIVNLIESGVKPSEIAIVTPIVDNSLKFAISEKLGAKNIKYQFFSGSEKLVSTPIVNNTITLLLAALSEKIDSISLRDVLCGLMKIPAKYCLPVINAYKNTDNFVYVDLGEEHYNASLKVFVETMEKIKSTEMSLSDKILCIYKNLVNLDKDEMHQIEAFNFFVKQIDDFESVFVDYKYNPSMQKAILTQLQNSIISENPAFAPDIENDSVVIATAQKTVDFSINRPYQIWLDITSSQWRKDDFGTLYNAWVFQRSWSKDEFTYEDNLKLCEYKLKKQLRKLSVLTQNIFAYSSFFDMEGNENFGGIESFVEKSEEQSVDNFTFKFIPREDQIPVLNYKSGKMAISAVPGAGKTTVLLALVIKLLQEGINSSNIFVLTYMDSAARNFKERIKSACPALDKMPNISTIHGLALRILKENSNYLKVGLENDFEVSDDNYRQRIIREVMLKLNIEQDDYEKYEKAVSAIKLSGMDKIPHVKDFELNKFLKFYKLYNRYLKARNLIDYDDMLFYSVKILEENKDTAEYYQDICEYLIEDEAQDSSYIQQRLLNILSAKHKNLIRCGDINQSITTTFTNTDLDGFRSFAQNSDCVLMNHSQRCAKGIYEFANRLIDFSKTSDSVKDAFFDIKMQGVEGKNPVDNNSLQVQLFEDYKQEQAFILEQIRKIQSRKQDSSIAILVRNNYHIEDYASVLKEHGYSVITKNDTLNSQPVFALVLSVLKFRVHPWNNENVFEFASVLKKQKLASLSDNDIEFIKNLKTPFILQNEQELKTQPLVQLLWDLNYWLEYPVADFDELVIKAGCYYYSTEVEKSNVYMVSLFVKNLLRQYSDINVFIEKITDLANKPALSKYSFFENQEDEDNQISGVQVMTYHKSKGDEFDYVFIPQLCEDVLALDVKNIKIKPKERFIEAVKAINLNYRKKDELALKKFTAQENIRLLYVAVTRAKKQLFITCAGKYKIFSKVKKVKPSVLYENLFNVSGV